MSRGKILTTECVSPGHPDKVADCISDAILDAYLEKDPTSKVAVETMVKNQVSIVAGEVNSKATVNTQDIVEEVTRLLGYTNNETRFSDKHVNHISFIDKQSSELSHLQKNNIVAGDQGFVYGYASQDTPNYLPLGSYLSRKLLGKVLLNNKLGPDAKSQVSIEYKKGIPHKVKEMTISTMHPVFMDPEQYRNKEFMESLLDEETEEIRNYFDKNTKFLFNPAGPWTVGGPDADCGLTGRKIVIDQYGPYSPVGGGAFSGKDPSKVDRSGAYLARWIAKHIVASGWAKECTVGISFIIGQSDGKFLSLDYGREKPFVPHKFIYSLVRDLFPLNIEEAIREMELLNPIYLKTSLHGHFGHSVEIDDKTKEFPWERLNKLKEFLPF